MSEQLAPAKRKRLRELLQEFEKASHSGDSTGAVSNMRLFEREARACGISPRDVASYLSGALTL